MSVRLQRSARCMTLCACILSCAVLWLDVHLLVIVWDTIQLSAAHPPLDPVDSTAITAHLERKVSNMIQQSYRLYMFWFCALARCAPVCWLEGHPAVSAAHPPLKPEISSALHIWSARSAQSTLTAASLQLPTISFQVRLLT
jgi:hypothetical protein